MLQVQLEIDSVKFFEKFNVNRIDVIAETVEQAIIIAKTIDPELEVIMPQYMVPIKPCTDYDYTNAEKTEILYRIGANMKARFGWILDSNSNRNGTGTMKFLCEVDTNSLPSSTEGSKEIMSEIDIYL
jgi:hypothetical protein